MSSATAGDAPPEEGTQSATPVPTPPAGDSPDSTIGARTADYIVVLDASNPPALAAIAVQRAAATTGNAPLHIKGQFNTALDGFVVRTTPKVAEYLKSIPMVAYVERDGPIRAFHTQSNPDWGLDRIDQRQLPIDGRFSYRRSGLGVHLYIVDTGVEYSNPDFQGRTSDGISFAKDKTGFHDDCHGHGTAVAGLAAGKEFGVAKDATIHSVKVLGCNGTGTKSALVRAIDWITQTHKSPAIANLSLGSDGSSRAINDAVRNAMAQGVTFIVAAGNGHGADSCNVSPASAKGVVSVGSTGPDDRRAAFSNIGTCVDIFAPGESIRSTCRQAENGPCTRSGTSMSAPLVAGAAAQYLEEVPDATPQDVYARITSVATRSVVGDPGSGSANRMLLVE